MYPSIIDQISGVRRVLRDVIRPAVVSDYERDILHWCARVLNAVAKEYPFAHELHVRELELITALLEQIGPDLDKLAAADASMVAISSAVHDAMIEIAPPLTDVVGTEACLERRRDLVADIVRRAAFQQGADRITTAIDTYVQALSAITSQTFGMRTYA